MSKAIAVALVGVAALTAWAFAIAFPIAVTGTVIYFLYRVFVA